MAVAIDYVPQDQWFVSGAMLGEQGEKGFYFDIKLTEGTNIKDEMARCVEAAFRGIENILGEVHPESYIYVQEIRGFAFGVGDLIHKYWYIGRKLGWVKN